MDCYRCKKKITGVSKETRVYTPDTFEPKNVMVCEPCLDIYSIIGSPGSLEEMVSKLEKYESTDDIVKECLPRYRKQIENRNAGWSRSY